MSPRSWRDTLGQVAFEEDVKGYDTLFYDTPFVAGSTPSLQISFFIFHWFLLDYCRVANKTLRNKVHNVLRIQEFLNTHSFPPYNSL